MVRVFVERLIAEHLMDITDDSNKMRIVQRRISSKLNLQEIAEISKEFGKNKDVTIIDCLRKRNIEVPKIEEEMDEMIEK